MFHETGEVGHVCYVVLWGAKSYNILLYVVATAPVLLPAKTIVLHVAFHEKRKLVMQQNQFDTVRAEVVEDIYRTYHPHRRQ